MPRFVKELATSTEADILVEGRVTLHFRATERGVRKVAATAYDRKPAVVSRQDFRDARTYAIGCMAEKEDGGDLTNCDIARILLRNAKVEKISVGMALNNFFASAEWCSKKRHYAILQEAGTIGSISSKNRARIRIRSEMARKSTARQLSLL